MKTDDNETREAFIPTAQLWSEPTEVYAARDRKWTAVCDDGPARLAVKNFAPTRILKVKHSKVAAAVASPAGMASHDNHSLFAVLRLAVGLDHCLYIFSHCDDRERRCPCGSSIAEVGGMYKSHAADNQWWSELRVLR